MMAEFLSVRQLLVVFPTFRPISFYRCVMPAYLRISMCLAIPAKIINLNGSQASVDFGQGVLREVNVSLVEAKVGDYVLVHAGYAIQVIEEKEALETIDLWNSILETSQE